MGSLTDIKLRSTKPKDKPYELLGSKLPSFKQVRKEEEKESRKEDSKEHELFALMFNQVHFFKLVTHVLSDNFIVSVSNCFYKKALSP